MATEHTNYKGIDTRVGAIFDSLILRRNFYRGIGCFLLIAVLVVCIPNSIPQAFGQTPESSFDVQNSLQIGRTLLRDNRFQELVSLMENKLATLPPHEMRMPLLLLLADGLLGVGDLERAEEVITEAENLVVWPEEEEAVNRRRTTLTVLSYQVGAAEEAAPRVEKPTPLEELPQEAIEPLVTNSFFETDIRQVLIDITMETGIPILWDATVEGFVTYEAEYEPLSSVLRAILFPAGYTFTYDDGTYYVGSVHPSDPAFAILSKTEVVRLSNLEASEAIDLLSSYFTPYVKAYDASNMVCITAPQMLINRIREDLEILDTPPDQILIEVIITEISTDALREMGLDWSLIGTTDNPIWDMTVDNTDIESPGVSGNYSELAVDIGKNTIDLVASLEMLVQSGNATIRANPRITTLNGRVAEISLTKDQYFIIQTGTSQYYQYNSLQAVSSGIRLQITPYTSTSGDITVYLQPEVGDVVGRGANDLPEISTRSANTSVRVKDGQTFTIGGLSLQQEKNVQKKIPFLGDIPFLGYLFRYDRKEVRDTEIVIFVTPHVLKG